MKMSFAGCLFTLFLGCSSVTPYENFKNILLTNVGRNIDDNYPGSWVNPEDLIDVTPLPNGNEEYRYKYLRTCRYIFEVDPGTRKIVGARFEDKESDCFINP